MKYKAIIYEIQKSPDGSITLKPVTSALYLTIQQIAETVGVSRNTIYEHIKTGKLRGIRLNSSCRVGLEDFLSYLKDAAQAEYERPMKRQDIHG